MKQRPGDTRIGKVSCFYQLGKLGDISEIIFVFFDYKQSPPANADGLGRFNKRDYPDSSPGSLHLPFLKLLHNLHPCL